VSEFVVNHDSGEYMQAADIEKGNQQYWNKEDGVLR